MASFVVKGKLAKHQKASKYYENDCMQNFLLLLMILVTAKYLKTVIYRLESTLSLQIMS